LNPPPPTTLSPLSLHDALPISAVQILGGILLNAEGGRLTLAATDMELSLRASLEAQVEGEGAVVVPGRLLVELARLLPDSEVARSEEHTSELQSLAYLVCRLLL